MSFATCSSCRKKYNSDDDFGYKRLNQRYKTCRKCRERKKKVNNTKDNNNIDNTKDNNNIDNNKDNNNIDNTKDNTINCVICFEVVLETDIVRIKCNHQIRRRCMLEWNETEKNMNKKNWD